MSANFYAQTGASASFNWATYGADGQLISTGSGAALNPSFTLNVANAGGEAFQYVVFYGNNNNANIKVLLQGLENIEFANLEPDSFTYHMQDADGDSSSATLSVSQSAPDNAVPVANTDTASTTEDTAVIINVLANDSDADGNPLTVSGVAANNGSVVINADGTLTYTPNANFSGTDSILYSIKDGQGGQAQATVNVTVNALADAPLLSPIADIHVLNPGATVISTGSSDVVVTQFDAEAGVSLADLELELGLTAGYLNNRFDPSGPNVTDPGTVTVIDGKLSEAHYSMDAGTTVTWDYSFTNGENLASEVTNGYNDLIVLLVTDPSGVQETFLVDASEMKFPALTNNDSFSYTAAQAGNYSFSWLVLNGLDDYKDSSLSLLSTRFTTVGDAAVYGAPVRLSLFAELTDQDGSENLSVSISGLPTGARFSSGSDNGGGSWSFTAAELSNLYLLPPAGFTGTLNLTVTASATETANANTASSSQNFTVTIGETSNTLTTGSASDQSLDGTSGNDLIRGYAGNDTVNGGDGNDLIYGGAGNDVLNAGNHNDHLYGGVGNDSLNGDSGNDYLDGGVGTDILNGGIGDDILRGGLGDDQLTGGTGADLFLLQRGDLGSDTIKDFNFSEGDRIDLSDLLLGEESSSDITQYLRVDTATSTLLISSTGVLNADGSNADASIKLENGGAAVNLNPGNLSQADLINSLIAGADPLIKTDHI